MRWYTDISSHLPASPPRRLSALSAWSPALPVLDNSFPVHIKWALIGAEGLNSLSARPRKVGRSSRLPHFGWTAQSATQYHFASSTPSPPSTPLPVSPRLSRGCPKNRSLFFGLSGGRMFGMTTISTGGLNGRTNPLVMLIRLFSDQTACHHCNLPSRFSPCGFVR